MELTRIHACLLALSPVLEAHQTAPPLSDVARLLAARLTQLPADASERDASVAQASNRSCCVSYLCDAVTASGFSAMSAAALRGLLTAAYDSVSPDDVVADAADALSRDGLPGQELFDAVVRFEAGRHMNLVKHQANRLVGSYPDYTPEDLFSWGWRGLLAALRRYNPESWEFSTYACTRIVGHIQDGIRSESRVPKRLTTLQRRVQRIEEELAQINGRPALEAEVAEQMAIATLTSDLGRRPSFEEIEQRLPAERAQLKLIPRLAIPRSLDEVATHIENRAADHDPDAALLASEQRDAIAAALAQLPDDEREAVLLLDYRGVGLEEAKGISGATARQLRTRRSRGREKLAPLLADWRS